MCVLSIMVPIRKMSGNLLYAPRTWNVDKFNGKKLFKTGKVDYTSYKLLQTRTTLMT